MPRILIAFVFIVAVIAAWAGLAQAQPQACILDCMAKNQLCQTPCFDAANEKPGGLQGGGSQMRARREIRAARLRQTLFDRLQKMRDRLQQAQAVVTRPS